MKKFFAAILLLCVLATLCACQSKRCAKWNRTYTGEGTNVADFGMEYIVCPRCYDRFY